MVDFHTNTTRTLTGLLLTKAKVVRFCKTIAGINAVFLQCHANDQLFDWICNAQHRNAFQPLTSLKHTTNYNAYGCKSGGFDFSPCHIFLSCLLRTTAIQLYLRPDKEFYEVDMSTRKDESVFSYSLSRPYPFRWFTYVVAIVGTICAVLFTFVALAADGYNLDLEYTLNLNSTLNELYWFQKAPFSWVSKTSASCQPALLTTGSTYFTSNLGFSYVLDALWREGLHETQNRILPATAYENALLEDCRVPLIEIDFVRNDQTMNEKNWWTWASTTASVCIQNLHLNSVDWLED